MPTPAHWDIRSTLITWERTAARSDPCGRVVGLTHPTYPMEVATHETDLQAALRVASGEYLSRTWVALDFPDPDLLAPRNDHGSWRFPDVPGRWSLAMLPVPEASDADPRDCVVVARRDPAIHKLLDRTVSVLIAQALVADDSGTAPRSQLGIRLHAHLHTTPSQGIVVHITSAMASAGLAKSMAADLSAASTPGAGALALQLQTFVQQARSALAAALGSDPQATIVEGLSLGLPAEGLGVMGCVVRSAATSAKPAHGVVGRIAPQATGQGGMQLGTEILQWHSLIAHATLAPAVGLFTKPLGGALRLVDPASQTLPGAIEAVRPNRAPAVLQLLRKQYAMPELGPGPRVKLKDPDPASGGVHRFEVRQSRLVDPAANEDQVQEIDLSIASARENAFAAASAYCQTRDMFNTVEGVGLSSDDFFRFATKPLVVRYRAALLSGPGGDGNAVNAQVEFDPPPLGMGDTWAPGALRPLQVRFALADLVRSHSAREPLGLCTDPRWGWHEFSHVLLAGATSRLELPFAHSVGDALAAIMNDPGSVLAGDGRARALRGATYPWVYLNRRHDREVSLGWGWSGRYHRAGQFVYPPCNCRHKGYDSEQILSTSLFRLYRALGGDTVDAQGHPAVRRREAAANYVAYLILRAVALLGSANAVPIETAQQFVALLMGVDAATQPAGSGLLKGRVGGCALKVLRWSFEAQGMYADVGPQDIHDAPGAPPLVDLYIEDGRPASEGAAPRGGYMPVSLHGNAAAGAPQPAWHAAGNSTQGAITVATNGDVAVRVHNRGVEPATAVQVQVSYRQLGAGTALPAWNAAIWTTAPATGPATLAPGGHGLYLCAGCLPAGAGRFLVLAHADADEDLAITNPVTQLPCSQGPVPLVDLVAGDNNLGLRLHVQA